MIKIRSGLAILILIATLVSASLSCSLFGGLQRVAAPPTATFTPIPITTEAVEALATEVQQAVATAQAGGPIILEITEEQATSAAATQLQDMGETRVSDIQVHFQNGQMLVSGTVEQNGATLPINVAVIMHVDDQGQPSAEIVSAKIGPLPVPARLLAEMTAQLDRLIRQQLRSSGSDLVVESISSENGKLTIVAHQK